MAADGDTISTIDGFGRIYLPEWFLKLSRLERSGRDTSRPIKINNFPLQQSVKQSRQKHFPTDKSVI